MKKILGLIIITIFSLSVYAQKDVTKFLGIPVDGTKSELMKKIQKKGFKKIKFANGKVLSGRFNNRDVNVDVHTNGEKAYRVVVWEKEPTDNRHIRIQFNNLCHQFMNNPNYISQKDWTIPENEDIAYEMRFNNKTYQAAFYQMPSEIGDSIIREQTLLRLLSSLDNSLSDEEKKEKTEEVYLEQLSEACSKKLVWFEIMELESDKYYLVMYYENIYNISNGEDL